MTLVRRKQRRKKQRSRRNDGARGGESVFVSTKATTSFRPRRKRPTTTTKHASEEKKFLWRSGGVVCFVRVSVRKTETWTPGRRRELHAAVAGLSLGLFAGSRAGRGDARRVGGVVVLAPRCGGGGGGGAPGLVAGGGVLCARGAPAGAGVLRAEVLGADGGGAGGDAAGGPGRGVLGVTALVAAVAAVVAGVALGGGHGPGALLLHVQDGPVVEVVVLEALAVEEFLEEPFDVRVVGPVLEAQRAAVLEVGPELGGVALAEGLRRRRHLAVHDALVLQLFGVRLQPLPRQRPADQVHQDVA
mmetsp:Transcript_21030/g.64943  ORF Transcript_21030/g.64943 Transcript_21030/m.64943 type:complete len:302 (+) Transcript_21030:373-1278(+)